MKLKRTSSALGLAMFTLLASPLAMADTSTWYGGFNYGQSRSKIDDSSVVNGVAGPGFATTAVSHDDTSNGYKVYAGYKFNQYFALEGGYFDLGTFSLNATMTPPGTLTGNIKLKGVNFDAVGTLPFTENFSGFARLGWAYSQAKDAFSGTGSLGGLNSDPSKSELNYKYGVGLEYSFTPSIGMRLEEEAYRVNPAVGSRGNVDLISLGLFFGYGG